jgi:hypothetical protein
MQVELKFVSLVWTHRRQHSCDYVLARDRRTGITHGLGTDLLVALFLPLGNQQSICVSIL